MANGRGETHRKHALVTGGSAGLGLAIAEACVARGMAVTIVGRDAGRLEAARERLGEAAQTIAADVAEAGAAADVVGEASRAAPLDIVCHAAGRSARGRVVETSREQHEALLAVNYLAAAELAAAAGPMLAERRGSFVLIGSLASRVAPAWLGGYPGAKHAVAALAQQLRMELGPAGLHTLLVCPGPLRRDDAGDRYDDQAADLPEKARRPGGGAKVNAIDPAWLAERILRACDERKAELVVPAKARLLFAMSQIRPAWGDWLLRRKMGG